MIELEVKDRHFSPLCLAVNGLTTQGMEVHAGWCPSGTSNPVGLPMVDRSVRFRHTSASLIAEGGDKLSGDPG